MKKHLTTDLGFSSPIHKNPDMVLEVAYSNPLVRRWHKKLGDNEYALSAWGKIVGEAGHQDVEALLGAFNNELIGFAPGNYWWEKHDGIYRPGKEEKILSDRGVKGWARENLGIDDPDPGVIINKLLGVTNPSQIAMRLAGTATPVLHPKVRGIEMFTLNNDNTLNVRVNATTGHLNNGATFYGFNFGKNGEPSGFSELYGLFLPSHLIGNGLGLAAYSSLQSWGESLGFDGVELDATDVGRYVWPRLGFDGYPYEDVANSMAKAIYFNEPNEFSGLEEVMDTVFNDTPNGLPDIATYKWGDWKVGMETLLSQPDLHDLSKTNNDNDRIYDVARQRVEQLEAKTT